MEKKPSVFIGSSSEGLQVAYDIQSLLAYDADVTVWPQGVFKLSETPIESLNDQLEKSDFAVLVLTPDDVITSRGRRKIAPRDNVLFELGLYMGKLGREPRKEGVTPLVKRGQ